VDPKKKEPKPTAAPGMNMNDDALEKKATPQDVRGDDATSVTRLFLDRTPED